MRRPAREQVEGRRGLSRAGSRRRELPLPARSRSRRSTSAELLPQLLQAISPTEPELSRIVEEHLAPFLESVRREPARRARAASRAIPLGAVGPARARLRRSYRSAATPQLQPILALLAGTPEAEMLDLALVAPRAASRPRPSTSFRRAFDFFGLRGSLTIASEQRQPRGAARPWGGSHDRARSCCAGCRRCCRRRPGGSARLLDEAAALPARGLLSPALTYEDGSIYFGGAAGTRARSSCGLSGYDAGWLQRGAPRPAPAGAAEIALLDRAALAAVGGFAGASL